jgi:hypothetical protein
MKFRFWFSFSEWALPLKIEWGSGHCYISLLCFQMGIYWGAHTDQTLAEELIELEEYIKDSAEFATEWRAEIQKRRAE